MLHNPPHCFSGWSPKVLAGKARRILIASINDYYMSFSRIDIIETKNERYCLLSLKLNYCNSCTETVIDKIPC